MCLMNFCSVGRTTVYSIDIYTRVQDNHSKKESMLSVAFEILYRYTILVYQCTERVLPCCLNLNTWERLTYPWCYEAVPEPVWCIQELTLTGNQNWLCFWKTIYAVVTSLWTMCESICTEKTYWRLHSRKKNVLVREARQSRDSLLLVGPQHWGCYAIPCKNVNSICYGSQRSCLPCASTKNNTGSVWVLGWQWWSILPPV